MAAGPASLLHYLHRLTNPSEPDGAADATLLGRFIAEGDEKAFTAMVDRHGPMVLHVCQRVLGNTHDAEDAFQAAFLVLSRKAATVHPQEALTAWLHGVARRVALKALSARVRRARIMRSPGPPANPYPDPLAEISARELLTIVDEEVRRLPKAYRLPVILCCLEGRSKEEAARCLGWTLGSVKGRLERGRLRLHDRLLRRGLTLSAALAAVEVARGAASPAVVARLVAATVGGTFAVGARYGAGSGGVSAGAAALAKEVVTAMTLVRLKIAAALLLVVGLAITGFVINQLAPAPATPPPSIRSEALPPPDPMARAFPALPVKSQLAVPKDEDAPIDVSGLVLDPKGQPVGGAKLYVGYSARRYAPDFAPGIDWRPSAYPLRATSGADGKFHFTFARSELDARWLDDLRPAIVAVAGGFGPDWAVIGEPGRRSGLRLQLVEDQLVTGRILDQHRQPVVGAKVRVANVVWGSEQSVTQFIRGEFDTGSFKTWRGPLPGQSLDITTDADGRFRLTGLGRDRIVLLRLEGSNIPHAFLQAVARPGASMRGIKSAVFEYQARPSKPIRGVVRDQATGRPVAGVKISMEQTHATALTDADGRFEIPGCPQSQGYLVKAQPAPGQRYLAAATCLHDKSNLEPLTVAINLVNGIPLLGRVMDQATHVPPKTAVVEYYPLYPNPHSAKLTNGTTMAASSAVMQPDGSFRLIVLPGPGVVCVAASPRDSYAVATFDDHNQANPFPGARDQGAGRSPITSVGANGMGMLPLNKFNALVPINPDHKAEGLTLDVPLQKANTRAGVVIGPNGEPLSGVEVVGLTAVANDETLDSPSFTVTGLNPRQSRDLTFQLEGRNLGKLLTIRGDETGPLTVQLQPCGSVRGRIVDRRGKPVMGTTLIFQGSVTGSNVSAKTDRDGRFSAALLPGQKYWVFSSSWVRRSDVGELLVEAGGSKDLGDLPIADRTPSH